MPKDGVEVKHDAEEKHSKGCCKKFTDVINGFLERLFEKLGYTVATNPWKTIIISLVIFVVCLAGLVEYQVENRGEKNWVAQNSDPLKHKDWVEERFEKRFRVVNVMLESLDGDILTNAGLSTLLNVYNTVIRINGTIAKTSWNEICAPTIQDANGVTECIPTSVLELYEYNQSKIPLTGQEIKNKINEKDLVSPLTKQKFAVKLHIGSSVITFSNATINTTIIRAAVAHITFRLRNQEVFDDGKGRNVDNFAESWEEEFEKRLKLWSSSRYKLYWFTKYGSSEASRNASEGDLQFFVVGYILVIIYLAIMLGSFSQINQKCYLAAAGIAVIGISIGISYGLGSAFQMNKTDVHNVLPFLLLGIGVDDIFVIVQNWDNIGGPVSDKRDIPTKIALALKHAGVSILVTSVTDICAFLIGATTILPALRSFCIWAGVGVLAVFIYTITFFIALLTLDARRQRNRRDACCCCIRLDDDWEPMECSKKGVLQLFMKNYYAKALLSIPGKIIVLLTVGGLFAGGIIGLLKLEQDFDFNWFLPKSSAPRQYSENKEIFFSIKWHSSSSIHRKD